MEEKRFESTSAAINIYFRCLVEAIERILAHVVNNMDELGHQEWSDLQQKPVTDQVRSLSCKFTFQSRGLGSA
jgi:hypothetical protein